MQISPRWDDEQLKVVEVFFSASQLIQCPVQRERLIANQKRLDTDTTTGFWLVRILTSIVGEFNH